MIASRYPAQAKALPCEGASVLGVEACFCALVSGYKLKCGKQQVTVRWKALTQAGN